MTLEVKHFAKADEAEAWTWLGAEKISGAPEPATA